MPKIFNQSPLLKGSLILFAGTMIANLGNYVYHLLMGRMLGPKDYGALTSLISLTYILSIISTTLSTTVVKFVTKYKAKNDYQSLSGFFWQLIRVFFVFSCAVLVFFVLTKNQTAEFLKLDDPLPVVWVGVWMFLSFLSFVNEGTLRGLLKFNFLSFNGVLATILKLGLTIIFVWSGLSVGGAVAGIALGLVLPYFLSFYPLKFLWFNRKNKVKNTWGKLARYTAPVLVANLGLTSLYSADVVLARHFLPTFSSGLYAALATMGKIVFFASGMIPMVMFPLVSEKHEKGESYREIIDQALWLVLGGSLFVTAIYFFFPHLMIGLLYGSAYLEAAPFLGLFAIFISIYSVDSLLVNFFLSVEKTKTAYLSFIAALLQLVLIYFFHESIGQIIWISLVSSALLLLSLLVCYWRYEKK